MSDTTILHKEANYNRRKIKESALILLNEDDCRFVSSADSIQGMDKD